MKLRSGTTYRLDPRKESSMIIYAIQTGTVAITKSWREGRGRGKRRLLNTLLDRQWTEPLPI
jgi:hypothetical protein